MEAGRDVMGLARGAHYAKERRLFSVGYLHCKVGQRSFGFRTRAKEVFIKHCEDPGL